MKIWINLTFFENISMIKTWDIVEDFLGKNKTIKDSFEKFSLKKMTQ